jgi:hypothetical protein
MANDFINTITTKDGTAYDVQDKRLTVTAADVGKVVAVDENGNLTLTRRNAKLYQHRISFDAANTNAGSLIRTPITTIYIISTYPNAYGFYELTANCGDFGVVDITDMRGVRFGYLRISKGLDRIDCMTGLVNGNIEFTGISNFTETVTEL